MKKVIFLAAIACLFAGCKEPTLKLKSDEGLNVNIKSEQGLPVKIRSQDEKPLPIQLAPDKLAIIAFVASLMAVGATSLAAIAAWWAARNTRKAAEGSLFSELIHRYDLEEMHEALKDIWNWGEPHLKGGKLEDEAKMIAESRNSNKKAGKIDQARRRVTHYYLNVLQLKRLRYIIKDVAVWIFEEIGVNILNVLEPLEKALIRDKNKDNQPKIDEEIKRLEKDFNEIRELAR